MRIQNAHCRPLQSLQFLGTSSCYSIHNCTFNNVKTIIHLLNSRATIAQTAWATKDYRSGHSAASFLCSSVYLIRLNQQVEEWPWNRQTHVSWSVLSRSHLTPVVICCVRVDYLLPMPNVPTHVCASYVKCNHTYKYASYVKCSMCPMYPHIVWFNALYAPCTHIYIYMLTVLIVLLILKKLKCMNVYYCEYFNQQFYIYCIRINVNENKILAPSCFSK